ncbi:sensor histidine kinase [uncultured Erythrobacter sp.]|uniref:sensor histidine kinase n=1 Tax=uncultured Erythrobacter sp. TaxID=263913 RepID=UPI00262E6565|nr:histidine kinase [uncultured Erythrobacter sp.]
MEGITHWMTGKGLRFNRLGVTFYLGTFVICCAFYLLLIQAYQPQTTELDRSDVFWNAVRHLTTGLVIGALAIWVTIRPSAWRLTLVRVAGIYAATCLCLYLPSVVTGRATDFAKDMITALIIIGVIYASRAAYTFVKMKELARQARKDKEEVEQQALNRRLSPHVLYNTLNAIYAESLTDPEATPELILALSTMLRHITDTSEGDFTNASDELNFIRNLCLITRKRGDERVRIELDFPDETDIQIPRLLCSTLVENAISHGRDRNGELDVLAYFSETEDGFVFVVTNECGADQISELDGLGSGIESISKRLKYLHPDRHRFVCKTLGHGRFHAEIETW